MFFYDEGAPVPENATHAIIDPCLKSIPRSAFRSCEYLKIVDLPEALETIDSYAFHGCKSLRRVNNLSNSKVNRISRGAFRDCERLEQIDLPDTVKYIGPLAFHQCMMKNMRVPPKVTKIDTTAFANCDYLFSLEWPKTIERIAGDEFSLVMGPKPSMRKLRNIAFPPHCQYIKDYICITDYKGRSDLQKIFPDKENADLVLELARRFIGLPVHSACYYQSYKSTRYTLNKIRRIIDPSLSCYFGKTKTSYMRQDCLGMTPLHILACSKKQNIDLYRFIIERHPEGLIIKDKWDAIPLVYAIWADAPSDVIEILVESHLKYFPDHKLDWGGIVGTLFFANVPFRSIKKILFTQHTLFQDHDVDWEEAIIKIGEIHEFDHYGMVYPKGHEAIFRFLFKFALSKRLNSLTVKTFQDDIEMLINDLSWFSLVRKGSIELVW